MSAGLRASCLTRYEAWRVTISALAPPDGRAGVAVSARRSGRVTLGNRRLPRVAVSGVRDLRRVGSANWLVASGSSCRKQGVGEFRIDAAGRDRVGVLRS